MDYRIFNVRTTGNACDCTRGCTDTARESALKTESWKLKVWKLTLGEISLTAPGNRTCVRGMPVWYSTNWATSLPSAITNEDLLHQTNSTPLVTKIKRQRWRWLGHVCRIPQMHYPTLESRWKTKAGTSKRKMEAYSGKGHERMWPDMGNHHQIGCRLTAVVS